jgi:hypothetical protein
MIKILTTCEISELHTDIPCMDFKLDKVRWIKVEDVLSALEGLKNIRYYYVEDSAVCGVCGETGFIFTFVEGENPIVSYTCPKCHTDKWFPFAHQIKTAEFDKGCEEFHKEWDEAGKGEGVLKTK